MTRKGGESQSGNIDTGTKYCFFIMSPNLIYIQGQIKFNSHTFQFRGQ